MKLICMECEKVFSRSNPTADTSCPYCHGYDIEPWAEDPEPVFEFCGDIFDLDLCGRN